MQPVGLLSLITCLWKCGCPLGMGQTQPGITSCVSRELQVCLNTNTENNDQVSPLPCEQPMHSLQARCSLHSSRMTVNPKSTVMKPLCCQEGYVYPPSPQQHVPTLCPTASINTTTRAANSSRTALRCTFCMLNSLNQHHVESDAQQCQCKGSSRSKWSCSGDRGKGSGTAPFGSSLS